MPRGPTTYIVRQGDYLARLAFALGFDPDAVWTHEKNADLRKLRSDNPDILLPGDVLYIHEFRPSDSKPIQAGQEHDFSSAAPSRTLALVVKYYDKALANEPYEIQGLGAVISGTTDADGVASFDVPVTIREISLVLDNYGPLRISVGDLDPTAEISGVQGRLRGLGHHWEAPTGQVDSATTNAIARFEQAQGLPITGQLTTTIVEAIKSQYGC